MLELDGLSMFVETLCISIIMFRMGDIHYLLIRDTFVLSPCAVGFILCNVREIYFLQMALGVFSVFVVR